MVKHQLSCESDYLFRSMARQITEAGESWSAMDAYLRILDSCNRCTVRDCPGMLAKRIQDDGQQHQLSACGDPGELMPTLIPEIALPPAGDDERTVDSLKSLANALPHPCCSHEPPPARPEELPRDASPEPHQEMGDRSALARLLGWGVRRKRR